MNMNETYKDTDLREALRRRYADTPQLSADFLIKMHHASQSKNQDSQPKNNRRTLRRWLYPITGIAASILLFLTSQIFLSNEKQQKEQPLIAEQIMQEQMMLCMDKDMNDKYEAFMAHQEEIRKKGEQYAAYVRQQIPVNTDIEMEINNY